MHENKIILAYQCLTTTSKKLNLACISLSSVTCPRSNNIYLITVIIGENNFNTDRMLIASIIIKILKGLISVLPFQL